MEEDSEDFVLKLYAGGKFNYSEKFHSHDAENGYNYDRKTDASGTWRLIRRDVGKEDLEEAIYLEGTATYHTVESHVRTCYNEDDELPEGMDETVTEKFTLSFAKAGGAADARCRTAQKRRLDRDGLATANTNDFGRRGSQLVGMMMAGMAAPRCQQGAWLLSKEECRWTMGVRIPGCQHPNGPAVAVLLRCTGSYMSMCSKGCCTESCWFSKTRAPRQACFPFIELRATQRCVTGM
ncbi:unnamed protein product [Symbiodinium sp. KB8]|nr:unnamed protein product [Symbiodinium sp. KB8]